jgi:GWxTD domain-containing protein
MRTPTCRTSEAFIASRSPSNSDPRRNHEHRATRSHPGARVAVWSLALLALPLITGFDEPTGPLPWRVSGHLGFTVDAAAFPDSAGDVLEVYCRLPPATIVSLEQSDRGQSRLKLSVTLHNRFGALHHQALQEFTVVPSDTGGFGKVVLMRFPVKPGAYTMDVKLEDPLSRKRGLAYIGRSVAHSASVRGEIVVPEASAGRRLSNLEFVWGAASGGGEVFRHARADTGFLPNPDRLYGLFEPRVRAQVVIRSPSPAEWHWRARVLNPAGREVVRQESTEVAAYIAPVIETDVSTMPAGGYDLEVQAWRQGEVAPITRRSHFSIAWSRSSWWRNPRDIEDEVHFLLDRAEDEEAFARMSAGEQEAYLEEFWHERDPTPSTAQNEARTEFFRRIQHANQTWTRSAALGKGMFSDMGRVYIRHGEPDEILRQVIPAGDQTLTNVLKELDTSEDRPTGDVEMKGRGGDIRPFEVWVYEAGRGPGITAKPDLAAGSGGRKRLTFLFVDEQGYGDYRLRYSTE